MSEPLLAAFDWKAWAACPMFWGILAAVVGLYLLVPPNTRRRQVIGGGLAWIGLALIVVDMLRVQWPVESLAPNVVFWLLAAVAIGGGVGTISAQSPIYSAMWFALSLLGVAALFLQQDAQFLGIATMIVYAGAIVVTFLFVLMLAQPEGHSTADRISWGVVPKIAGVIVAGTLVGTVAHVIHPPNAVAAATPAEGEETVAAPVVSKPQGSLRDQLAAKFPEIAPRLISAKIIHPREDGEVPVLSLEVRGIEGLKVNEKDVLEVIAPIAPDAGLSVGHTTKDLQSDAHMANLGGYLFSRHLIAVELAGTLLLAALVGAVSMIIQGRLAKEGARDE